MKLFKWVRYEDYPKSLMIYYRSTDDNQYFIALDRDSKWYASRHSNVYIHDERLILAEPPDNKFQRTLINFIFKDTYLRKSFYFQ